MMRTEQAHLEEAGTLPRFLAALATGVCRRPWLVLAGSALVVGLSLVFTLTHLQYQTQRNDLISPHKDYYKRWQQYVAEFGHDEDMVVVVKGENRRRMIAALEELAAAVHKQPTRFDRLFYKVDLRPLGNRALLFLSSEQIRKIQDYLRNMSLLLDPPFIGVMDPLFSWKSLTLQQLFLEGEKQAAAYPADRAATAQLFSQLDHVCQVTIKVLDHPAAYRNPWQNVLGQSRDQRSGVRDQESGVRGQGSGVRGQGSGVRGQKPGTIDSCLLTPDSCPPTSALDEPQYFFSEDGSLAFLLVRAFREDSFTGANQSVSAMRRLLEEIKPRCADLEFGLTGLPVLENDEMRASERDSNLASWLALAGVALLYLLAYRSWRYPILTVVTLLTGTAWALGWLTLTVGHLNILSASFAVMLIGMGDYGVLWVTRYGQERQAGADLRQAMRITAASVGPSIVTAATTTALAFFATMLADFKAVVELGWIAGCGILFCALACFLVLPAMVAIWDGRKSKVRGQGAEGRNQKSEVRNQRSEVRGQTSDLSIPILSLAHHSPLTTHHSPRVQKDHREWLPGLLGRPRLVIAVTLVLALVMGFFALDARYDHNLLHMQARDLDSVQWEETLIGHTAGASWHALSYTTTPEEALALKTQYEKLPEVSRVVEVASLVPRDQERKLEQLKDIQFRLRRLPKRGSVIPHALPRIDDLERALARLSESLGLLEEDRFPEAAGLRKRLHTLQARLANCSRQVAARRLQDLEENLARDLAEDLHRLRDVSIPLPIEVADLPASLRERYIGRTGKWLLCVFAKDSLWEFQPLERFVAQVQTVDPEATGKPFTTLEGLKAMKSGFLMAALYAALAMVLVLFLDFRSWKYTLLALAPLGMGLCATLGLMVLLGIDFNPANMIALPLILGVGADNGVHVLHDYRSRGAGIYNLSQATGRGITVAALTTILGFGTLMISNHRGIYSLGLALSLGVTCCMLTALIFLPALLRLKTLKRLAKKAEKNPDRRAA